jgi:UDP-glucose 4-epimerase
MAVLVTGGAGFIGSHLVDALLARREDVVVLDDLSTGRRENLAGALERGAHLVEGDITDPGVVAGLFDGANVEAVAHLAAQMDVRRSVADPGFDLRVNVGGTINLLERSTETGVGRFVLASTGGAIYGEGAGRSLPLDETAECEPEAPYGQSKLAAEGYVSLFGRLYGLSGASLRLGNVYGPRQDPLGEAGVVAIFAGALLDGRRPRVFGDGRQTRDYVYVGDVVEALLAALDSEVEGVFNIGTGIETDVLALGERIARACGREFDPEMTPERPGEAQRIAISSALAERELGWRPATDLDRGLTLTTDSFREGDRGG